MAERRVVRKSAPKEVQRRANVAFKQLMPDLFKAFSAALPVQPKQEGPKPAKLSNPVDDQEPVQASLNTQEPPQPEVSPPQQSQEPLSLPAEEKIKQSDLAKQAEPAKEQVMPKQEPKLEKGDTQAQAKPIERDVQRAEEAQPKQPKQAQARTKRVKAQRQQHAKQTKAQQQKPNPRAPRPAGQGTAPPQFFANVKYPVDPNFKMDFDAITMGEQGVLDFEDQSDSDMAYHDQHTNIVERLVSHVAALTTRLRLVEDTLNRMRL